MVPTGATIVRDHPKVPTRGHMGVVPILETLFDEVQTNARASYSSIHNQARHIADCKLRNVKRCDSQYS